MWYSSSCGRIALQITKAQAASASHMWQCDADVLALSKVPRIARQLAKIRPDVLSAELFGYGAWEMEDLEDHATNLQRLLWLACGDITEVH